MTLQRIILNIQNRVLTPPKLFNATRISKSNKSNLTYRAKVTP